MRLISDDTPPDGIDPDLSQWLSQLVDEINVTLLGVHDYPPLYVMPDHQFIGMVRYFGGPVLPDIPAEGLYARSSTGWVAL